MHPQYRHVLVEALVALFVQTTARAAQLRTSAQKCGCVCCKMARDFFTSFAEQDEEMAERNGLNGLMVFGERFEMVVKTLERGTSIGSALGTPGGLVVLVLNGGWAKISPGGKLEAIAHTISDAISSIDVTELLIRAALNQLSSDDLKVVTTGLTEDQSLAVLEHAQSKLESLVGVKEAFLILLEEAEDGQTDYVVVDSSMKPKSVTREEFLRHVHQEKASAPAKQPAPAKPVAKVAAAPVQATSSERIRSATMEVLRTRGSATLDEIMGVLAHSLPNTCAEISKEYANGVRAYVRDYLYRVRDLGIVDQTGCRFSFVAK